MITNMMGAYIKDIKNIKCSSNWMWPDKKGNEGYKLYENMKHIVKMMKILEIGIDGGKDSLSMRVNHEGKTVKSPGNIVITGYAPCYNINKNLTPNFKNINSNIVYISFCEENICLGGTALYKKFNLFKNDSIEKVDIYKLKKCFNVIQNMIVNNLVSSLHDISDGGFITCLIEMCISSNIGCSILLRNNSDNLNNFIFNTLFNENLGILLEVNNDKIDIFSKTMLQNNIDYKIIGKTCIQKKISINVDTYNIVNMPLHIAFSYFDKPSYIMEKQQCHYKCALEEYEYLCSDKNIQKI